MPKRITPLVTGNTYHVYNRGIDHQPTFLGIADHKRALATLNYYQYQKQPIRLSQFNLLDQETKLQILEELIDKPKHAQIVCYCLMPNHFHLLLTQLHDNGISKFLSNFQNSYTKAFNIKRDRQGSLFLTQFKAVQIYSDELLLHVSRYIHLNPHTSQLIKTINKLPTYPWSSFSEFITPSPNSLSNPSLILDQFQSPSDYKKFVYARADYQRQLHRIKHLTLDR